MTQMDWVRGVTSGFKVGVYLLLAVTLWRFRRRSEFRGTCSALVVVFATSVAMTVARIAYLATDREDFIACCEIIATILTTVAAVTVWRDTRD